MCLIASRLRVRASEGFGSEHERLSGSGKGAPTIRGRPDNVVASVCDAGRAGGE